MTEPNDKIVEKEVIEEKVEPEVEEPKAPVIDTAKIASDVEATVSEKVEKSVLAKIGEALGLTKKEEAKLPTDPEELRKLIEENSERKVKEILNERDKQTTETEKARQAEIEQGSQRYTQLWNSQFDQLSSSGKVPKIENKDDPNDKGVIAKRNLLLKLKERIDYNQAHGIDEVPTLKEIYYEYPEAVRGGTRLGNDAPVLGDDRIGGSGSYTYKDIHNSTEEDILKNG